MADVAEAPVQSGVLETSPASVESPTDAGLGATDAQAGSDKANDGYRKLQSQLDRERRRREAAEEEASRAYRLIGDAKTRQSFEAEYARLPDKYADPEGRDRALKALSLQHIELAHQRAAEATDAQSVRERTNVFVATTLSELNAKYGVELTRDDERIEIRGKGEAARALFLKTAEAAAREAAKDKKIAELEARTNATLREAGIDTFDSGGASGGGRRRSWTPREIGLMTPEEYVQNRDAIRAPGGIRHA